MLPYVIVLSTVSWLPFGIGYSRVDTTTPWSKGWFFCGGIKFGGALAMYLIGRGYDKLQLRPLLDIGEMFVLIFSCLMFGAGVSKLFDNVLYFGHWFVPKVEGDALGWYLMKSSKDPTSHTFERAAKMQELIDKQVKEEMRVDLSNQPSAVLTMSEEDFHSYYQYNPVMKLLLAQLRLLVNSLDEINCEAKDGEPYLSAIESYTAMQAKYEKDTTTAWAQQFKDISGKGWTSDNCNDIGTNAIRKLWAAHREYERELSNTNSRK